MMIPNIKARKMVAPMTLGVSRCRMLVTIMVPRPGMEKTVSVMTAPPRRPPKEVAITVMMGRRAFCRAWWKMMRPSGTPLALAVRI